MKNLRYINLGGLSGAKIAAEHELTRHLKFVDPLITSFFAEKSTLTVTGLHNVDKYLKLDEVTEDVEVARIDSKKSVGSLLLDTNSALIHLHIKKADIGDNKIEKIMLASIARVMKEYNVTLSRSGHRSNSNDIVIKEDEIYKKVGGSWSTSYCEEYKVFGVLINFKASYNLLKQAFRMDTAKMESRKTDKIEDVVTGLGCENEKEEIMEKVINEISRRLNFNLLVDELSIEESNTLNNISKLLSSNDWIYNAKR